MMKRILLLLCLLLPALVSAEDTKPLQLDVSGDITIDQGGVVHEYKIHTPLAPQVKQLVETAVSKWRFEPVVRNGKGVHAKASMFLLLAASPVNGGYRLKIERVSFGSKREVVSRQNGFAQFSKDAIKAGVPVGYALVAQRIDREGNVIDAVAVQTMCPSSKDRNAGGRPCVSASRRLRFG